MKFACSSARIRRRQFLGQATTAVGAAVAGNVAVSGASPVADATPFDQPIVDTHQHLWDLKIIKLDWVKGNDKFNRNFLLPEYTTATAGLKIAKTVYMEVDVAVNQQTVDQQAVDQQAAEAEWIVELAKQPESKIAGAVISGRPETDRFAAYIEPLARHKVIKGLRRLMNKPQTSPEAYLSKTFIDNVRLLGKLGLSFDLHPKPTELDSAAKLVGACPDTAFVLDHCGCVPPTTRDLAPWKRGIDKLASYRRVDCKISGIVALAAEKWTADDLAPIVNHCLTAFGPDRVCFGGDWPVCTLRATYRQWVEALRTIVAHRPAEEQRKLWHDNALRIYRLA